MGQFIFHCLLNLFVTSVGINNEISNQLSKKILGRELSCLPTRLFHRQMTRRTMEEPSPVPVVVPTTEPPAVSERRNYSSWIWQRRHQKTPLYTSAFKDKKKVFCHEATLYPSQNAHILSQAQIMERWTIHRLRYVFLTMNTRQPLQTYIWHQTKQQESLKPMPLLY